MNTKEPLSTMAIVALGSNLGDSAQTVYLAMARLENLSATPLLRSSLWRTSPVDCPPDSPPFINAVVGLTPPEGETPESLLTKLQHLETEFGREPKQVMNEARTLDLDLIAFGDVVRESPILTLPHPRAHLRRFVLGPLAEIAPALILPRQTQTVVDLFNKLPNEVSDHRGRMIT